MSYPSNANAEIYRLRNKIGHGKATSAEMKRYLNLLLESSDYNKEVVEEYIHEIGYNSIGEFQEHFNEKGNQEIINGLLMIGGAVLLGYLLNKLSE